jgi:3-isopropylmalate/(R)-2-methylmalate dehydratase small subunit
MQPFDTLSGIAVPLLIDDLNTDQIAPVGHTLHPDYGAQLFRAQRILPDGRKNADFVLNQPQFHAPSLLVTGRNFGCGSSREAAVWGMIAVGIRCIVARTFADTFRENCLQNGVLPVVLAPADAQAFEAEVVAVNGSASFAVDLRRQALLCPSGVTVRFDIAEADRTRLLEGLDDIGMTLKYADDIAAWEAKTAQARPWLQTLSDSRKR